jgi:hypothetical protein
MAVWPKLWRGAFWNLLNLSFTVFMGLITCYRQFACLECMTVVPGAIFWINPPAYKYLPKLMEFISLNPYTYVW